MEAFGLLLHGFAVLLTWKTLALMMVGLVLGIFVGVLPGLGGPNGVAILLPLTFTMDPTSAIVMLSCIYWGALFGGAITSILFNIPGEAWSVATTFDGYPMAQQGRAAEALTAAFTSSFIGSLVAALLSFAYLYAISIHDVWMAIIVSLLMWGVIYQGYNAVFPSFYPELFRTRYRVSAMAIGQNIGTAISAFLPALFTAVAPPGSGDIPLKIGAITLGVAAIAAIAAFSARETYRLRLNDLGNPDAAPLPKDEYDRLRARTELDTGGQSPSLASG